jgi:Fe-coproporphyrin III synthase
VPDRLGRSGRAHGYTRGVSASDAAVAVRPPEWLVLGVNNLCNMHCLMCDVGLGNTETTFYTNLMGTRPINMPLPLFERIVDQAATHWPAVKVGFAFTEPLIYPHLFDAVALAHARGLHTAVTTNGLQLDTKGERLADAGVDEIFVSLDGPADAHDRIRGHAGAFARAFKGLQALTRRPDGPRCSVFCVITEWNAGRLVEMAEAFHGVGLRKLGFMHALFTPQSLADAHNTVFGDVYPATASNLGEHDAARMDFDALAGEIARLRSGDFGFPIVFSPDLHSAADLRTFYLDPATPMGRACHDVNRTLMIKSDGSTVPAHGRCYNLNAGNVYERTLPEIWHGAALTRLRHDLDAAGGLLPACSRCCSAFAGRTAAPAGA